MSDLNEIKKLKPFPKFCCSIGMIPSSYKVSLSYEEQLFWLCDFLENTVIPTVNQNGQAVEELQNLLTQLKNYVDEYFSDLNVQNEINNKLDEMATDGTLAQIINENIFEELNQDINNLEAQLNQDINNLETQLNQSVNNINDELNEINQNINKIELLLPSFANETASQSIALLKSENYNLLFDTGDATSYMNNLTFLENKLNNKKINAIFISHYHYDHIGGLQYFKSLMDDNCVVYLPLNMDQYYNDSTSLAILQQIRTNVINWLITNDIQYVEINQDTLLTYENDDFTVQLLNSTPQAYNYYNSVSAVYNSYSMNAIVKFGDNKILFPR